MKNIKWILVALMATLLLSCSKEELDPDSIFGREPGIVENEFDSWLYNNYTKPYNIDFKYRLDDKETNLTYNLIPAEYDKAIALSKMIKHAWLGSYEEAVDSAFIRTYCPKMILLVGSAAYNSNGTRIEGTAEGGLKITLFDVNSIDIEKITIQKLNSSYFSTMHHEFAHILHQTKNYSPDFNLISAGNYQSGSWVNIILQKALDNGFISTYGSSEPNEDFAEIVATYVTNTPEDWQKLVKTASTEGQDKINRKLEIIQNYMLTSWGINMDELRKIVLRRSQEILTMDLTTLK